VSKKSASMNRTTDDEKVIDGMMKSYFL
jgi:hypothetical protein